MNAIVTLCSDQMLPLHTITGAVKDEYCDRWKNSCTHLVKRVPETCGAVAGYERMEFILELMKSNHEIKWFWAQGVDTMLMNHRTTMDRFFDLDYHFIISHDGNALNADSYVVRNSDVGRRFLKDLINNRKWYIENHPWADSQAITDAQANSLWSQAIKVVPQKSFNSYDERLYPDRSGRGRVSMFTDGDFLIHWPGLSMEHRLELAHRYRKRIVWDGGAKTLSFSLYGSNPKYTTGMLRNIELASIIYPDWCISIYHRDVPENVFEAMSYENCISMNDNPWCPPMMQRFLVADDHRFERFCIRDADSRLSWREKVAVDDWVESDLILHVGKDHPSQRDMNGCFWGATWHRKDGWHATSMEQLMKEWLASPENTFEFGAYGQDEAFAQQKIWPWAKDSCLLHDSVPDRRALYPMAKPFSTKRHPWPRFCGEVWMIDKNGDEYPRNTDWESCPLE